MTYFKNNSTYSNTESFVYLFSVKKRNYKNNKITALPYLRIKSTT